MDKLQTQLKKLQDANSTLESDLKQKDKELSVLRTKVQDLESQANDVNARELLSNSEKLTKLTESLKTKEQEVQDLKDQLTEVKATMLNKLKAADERCAQLEVQIIELQKKVPSNDKHIYDSDDMGLLVVENESLKRKIKMLELKISDQPSAEKISQRMEAKDFEIRNLKTKLEKADNDVADLKRRLDSMKSEAFNQENFIERADYQKLEKNYIESVKKIGDALMIIQNIKLKKDDKDKIVNCLVAN